LDGNTGHRGKVVKPDGRVPLFRLANHGRLCRRRSKPERRNQLPLRLILHIAAWLNKKKLTLP
jgi:hypothetical protein